MLAHSAEERWTPQSVVVAIDEKTLTARGGIRNLRNILSETLDSIAGAQPRAVVSDVLLNDVGEPVEDKRLAASLRATRNLILPCDVIATPPGRVGRVHSRSFKESSVALGHVDLEVDRSDGVSRRIPLERHCRERSALGDCAASIQRDPRSTHHRIADDVQVGDTVIRRAAWRCGARCGSAIWRQASPGLRRWI